MTSQNPQSDIYNPKTLVQSQDTCSDGPGVRRHLERTKGWADDPFRDYANDTELRIAIGYSL